MKFLVFYCFVGSGEEVSSSSPERVDRDDIVQDLIPRLRDADDYIGILDANETLLQLSYQPGQGRYLLELPVLDERASWACELSLYELCECVGGLHEAFVLEDLPELERRAWR